MIIMDSISIIYNFIYYSYSGGQQRRVSLCIAVIHSPQLLILDEPTVGIDVMLAHR